MKSPDPLIVSWQGREVRIRHDDPHLGPYTPRGAVIRSAVELASDVDGLRLVLASTVGDRCRVRVSDDGGTVGLWRRAWRGPPQSGTGLLVARSSRCYLGQMYWNVSCPSQMSVSSASSRGTGTPSMVPDTVAERLSPSRLSML